MFDAVKVKNECVQWIRDWFAKNGPECNAVIGISGGKDSSVAAALCVEALGKDRVIGKIAEGKCILSITMDSGDVTFVNEHDLISKSFEITDYVVDVNEKDKFYKRIRFIRNEEGSRNVLADNKN